MECCQNIGGAVGGAIAALFPPNPIIPRLVTTPPPAPEPTAFEVLLSGFGSYNKPKPPTADELAAQALANLQVAATANQPDPSLVINTPGAGAAGGNFLSGDLGTPLFNLTEKQSKNIEKAAKDTAKRDEKAVIKAKEKAEEDAKLAGTAGGI